MSEQQSKDLQVTFKICTADVTDPERGQDAEPVIVVRGFNERGELLFGGVFQGGSLKMIGKSSTWQ